MEASMVTRRTFVQTVILLPAFAGLLTARGLADDSKTSQSSVHYQTQPSGDKQCSKCAFFIPGGTADANGSCKVVDGVISPNGYCIAYNPK
jgi:hypothetical protein